MCEQPRAVCVVCLVNGNMLATHTQLTGLAAVLKEPLLVGWWMYSMGLQSSLHLEEDH